MKDLVQYQLDQYFAKTEQDEENALKEITQEIALYSLAKSGFFEHAAFQGGTCLRIVHHMNRFSEDLDFSLKKAQDFDLGQYLEKTAKFMQAYGFEMEIFGEEKADKSVQTRFLKDNSIKQIITLKHLNDTRKKINIKIELDTNPPSHALDEVKYIEFPTDFSILCHDLPTLMSGKIHALLCREYVKGRDWYDFNWYITKKVTPNYKYLESAIYQSGPWKGKKNSDIKSWTKKELGKKINALDWKTVIDDVLPFLRNEERTDVKNIWSKDFFLMKIEKLN